ASIDGGAFHTDMVAVANDGFLMLHESAFRGTRRLLAQLKGALGAQFSHALARSNEIPLATAVKMLPFNSQIVTLPNGSMAIIAPKESGEAPACRTFLERVRARTDTPIDRIHYHDLGQSMKNGGGPAC